MNTTHFETELNLTAALSYYNAMVGKDFEAMAIHLSGDARLISPLAEIHGKKEVLAAAKNFSVMLMGIQMRSQFANNDQVMLAYNMTIPEPIGQFRAAALMDFKNRNITKIELFYDARPF